MHCGNAGAAGHKEGYGKIMEAFGFAGNQPNPWPLKKQLKTAQISINQQVIINWQRN